MTFEHIDRARLDQLRDNPHAKMQIEQELNKIFMRMFTLFGYPDAKRASYYTEYFMEKEYLLVKVEEAVEKSIEQFSKAPSIKDIVDLMSGSKRVEKEVTQEWREDFDKEEQQFERLKERYIDLYGQESLDSLVKTWVIEQHEEEHYNWLVKFHPSLLKSLEKPALFDFAEMKRNSQS